MATASRATAPHDLPLAFTATLRHEVAVQQLVADAALLGSRDAALQALLIDPVVGSSRAADAILADFEAAHADLWPAPHLTRACALE